MELENFTTTTTGIQTTGQASLMQLPTNTSYVLNGSYIVFSCISGYVNTGGSLNVTCGQNGSWSTFPHCVSSTASVTTTTIATGTGSTACVVDTATTFTITNGYLLSSALSFTSNTAATGS